jgi:poly(A) polymerase
MEVRRKPELHRDWIDPHAYGIVKALQKGGFTTYLVGGCVRDLMLGSHPKDFDIATAAHPPQVKRLIYMSFIIGKRFRLVLVKRDEQQFEVATFRREVNPQDFPEGLPPGDNIFGPPEEDAKRRDFTVNGLFYDPIADQLIDYVDGVRDIEARVLRMIGDPDTRLVEDSIRILRGLRLSHKMGFAIDPDLRAAMVRQAPELAKSVLPRRREEILKILRLDEPHLALAECLDLGILEHVVPTLHSLLLDPERRELFFHHFHSHESVVVDPADPSQLFAWLVYAMLRTAQETPSSERSEPLTVEDEIFQKLMRDELGMFKLEQASLTKAIDLVHILHRTDDFQRRGERRQLAIMRNDGFQLSLRIAEADRLLSGPQMMFWLEAWKRLSPELQRIEQTREAEGRPKRRRRPRRKPRAEKGTETSAFDPSDDSNNDLDNDLDDDIADMSDLEFPTNDPSGL